MDQAFHVLKRNIDTTLEIDKVFGGDVYSLNDPLHVSILSNRLIDGKMQNYFVSYSSNGLTDSLSMLPDSTKCYPAHRHNYFELMIVVMGNVTQVIEEKEYLYPQGSCCLINRNITHTERITEESLVVFVGFTVTLVQELMSTLDHSGFSVKEDWRKNLVMNYLSENVNRSEGKYYMDIYPTAQNDTSEEDLNNIMEQLIDVIDKRRFGYTFLAKALLCRLFSFISDEHYYHIVPVRLNSQSGTVIFHRIQNLMKDSNGRISRSELEKALHYAGTYLNAIVKKQTGMTLFQYGMTFCMEKAKELLTETDMPISEIILELDFSNRGHFYKLFKSKFGMLPMEYRQKYRNTPSA